MVISLQPHNSVQTNQVLSEIVLTFCPFFLDLYLLMEFFGSIQAEVFGFRRGQWAVKGRNLMGSMWIQLTFLQEWVWVIGELLKRILIISGSGFWAMQIGILSLLNKIFGIVVWGFPIARILYFFLGSFPEIGWLLVLNLLTSLVDTFGDLA